MARLSITIWMALMDIALTSLVTFVLTLAAVAAGWFGHRWYLASRPSSEQRSDKRCDVCQVTLPPTARRTHDGHWRCARHKQDAA